MAAKTPAKDKTPAAAKAATPPVVAPTEHATAQAASAPPATLIDQAAPDAPPAAVVEPVKEEAPSPTVLVVGDGVMAMPASRLATLELDPVLILGDSAGEGFLLALADVAAERLRQVGEEGYTPERDDELSDYQLPRAAASYVSNAAGIPRHKALLYWPFPAPGFKPTTRRADYVKGAALLLAEIERLDRLEAAEA
jgi:hypothetical protein